MNLLMLTIGCAAILAAAYFLRRARGLDRPILAYGTSAAAAVFAVATIGLQLIGKAEADDPVSLGLSAGYQDFAPRRSRPPSSAARSTTPALPSVPDMIHQLEARLEASPADAQGWSLLAKSYAYIGNERGADEAIANAVRLGTEEGMLRSQVTAVRSSAPAR